MSTASREPRVTLGIATYERDAYLAEAIRSGLEQEGCGDFELLVVCDGSTNPAIDEVLEGFAGEPRLRVVRHPENRGIAAAYDTIWREGRGELIAMLGDDDVCLPDRLARQVALFDRHPDTGVVHGDALVIDAAGAVTGRWDSADFTPAALLQAFVRRHNYLVDPTRMVHRRVYEAVGGYDSSYPIAQDLHFWLRATAAGFRFRHAPGGPLIGFRRHGENTSDESARAQEIADVERALGLAIDELFTLRELVPELDWAVLDPADAERQARERLADALEARQLPLPGLAARVRERAATLAAPAGSGDRTRDAPAGASRTASGVTGRAHGAPAGASRTASGVTGRVHGAPAGATRSGSGERARGRLLMTAFGFNDSGGGTIVPRLTAKELARRGWDVTVFHAAVELAPDQPPYHVAEFEEDGVRLLAVHNRRHGLWDKQAPLRELDDPPITAAYAAALDRVAPDVVHFHNLHNLGAALIDQTAARGIPSFFSTHNYWLACPRAYLQTGAATICAGPGDGARCASCCERAAAADEYRRRLGEIRARVSRGVTSVLAVSDAVRHTLLGAGYPAELVEVVRQGMPHDTEIWERLGRDRTPGRAGGDAAPLTVAFVGSAYPLKGPQLLVEAAQRVRAPIRVQIHGKVPAEYRDELLARDHKGLMELCGEFHASEMARVLAGVDAVALPSVWWDCAPLVAAECLAGRVPLVVPRLGGLAEAVRDGVDGLVFDGLDVGALAAALERLAGEPGLLERLQQGIEAPRAFAAYVDDLEARYGDERALAQHADARPARDASQGHAAAEARDAVVGAARTAAALAPEQVAVLWREGPEPCALDDALPPRLPGPVQRLARTATGAATTDAPLPHVAHVEVRTQWPPDPRPAAAGRLVIVQPAERAADRLPPEALAALAPHADELWVPDEDARTAAVAAGIAPERVVVVGATPRPPDAAPLCADALAARIAALANRPPRIADPACATPRELEEDAELRVLATPAWRGEDRLPELLAQWCAHTTRDTSACLYLLADPAVDGAPEELEQRVLQAAAQTGADLDACADVNVLMEPLAADRDAALHAAIPLYVPLHRACTGHGRLARATGGELLAPGGPALAERLAAAPVRTAA
jgi:glycosyltransferase involved in cell wall biosynthesis